MTRASNTIPTVAPLRSTVGLALTQTSTLTGASGGVRESFSVTSGSTKLRKGAYQVARQFAYGS